MSSRHVRSHHGPHERGVYRRVPRRVLVRCGDDVAHGLLGRPLQRCDGTIDFSHVCRVLDAWLLLPRWEPKQHVDDLPGWALWVVGVSDHRRVHRAVRRGGVLLPGWQHELERAPVPRGDVWGWGGCWGLACVSRMHRRLVLRRSVGHGDCAVPGRVLQYRGFLHLHVHGDLQCRVLLLRRLPFADAVPVQSGRVWFLARPNGGYVLWELSGVC